MVDGFHRGYGHTRWWMGVWTWDAVSGDCRGKEWEWREWGARQEAGCSWLTLRYGSTHGNVRRPCGTLPHPTAHTTPPGPKCPRSTGAGASADQPASLRPPAPRPDATHPPPSPAPCPLARRTAASVRRPGRRGCRRGPPGWPAGGREGLRGSVREEGVAEARRHDVRPYFLKTVSCAHAQVPACLNAQCKGVHVLAHRCPCALLPAVQCCAQAAAARTVREVGREDVAV